MNIPVEKFISVSPKRIARKFFSMIKAFYKAHPGYKDLEEASEVYISWYLSEYIESAIDYAVEEQAPGCGVDHDYYIQLEEEVEEIVLDLIEKEEQK